MPASGRSIHWPLFECCQSSLEAEFQFLRRLTALPFESRPRMTEHWYVFRLGINGVPADESLARLEKHQLLLHEENLIREGRVSLHRIFDFSPSRKRDIPPGDAARSLPLMIEPFAPAQCLDCFMPGALLPDTVLGVMVPQGIEERDRDVFGGELGGLGTPLPEPLMPPAVLQHIAPDLWAWEPERILNQDVEFQPPFACFG